MKTFTEEQLKAKMEDCLTDATTEVEKTGCLTRYAIRQFGSALTLAELIGDDDARSKISDAYKTAWKNFPYKG